ncbi:hypothetical protein GA0116948_105151 [Chitinophaga costaii]|uniref:Uncharacterized protein n=1 Tax=Chitinophaga costaii TaxID=1335309 RepID=A0A1C4D9T6_9BACT|nr:hypothetical protein [Chitinophaga costaii]PUZ24521.1 hypothetical protein DCM91_11520 [Chitinophaga costaii]SCC28062.1 hypothetical protein GA0116948_105151 [Chitinophaga costaii]
MDEDILIDFKFKQDRPGLGDLFLITGTEHAKFPAKTRNFEQLAHLGFEQIHDFFGILNEEEAGDDVIVWLFPMIRGEEAIQHAGPFDAVRLSYNALRNVPGKSVDVLEECYDLLLENFDVQVLLNGLPIAGFEPVSEKISQIVGRWRAEGIEPGSEAALLLEDDEDWDDEDDDFNYSDDDR